MIIRGGHPDFLDLPWGTLLDDWDPSLFVKMAHGLSRHVVRFVRFDKRVYALKQTDLLSAQHEHATLKRLKELHLPTVEPVGYVAGTPDEDQAVLITRYLDYSLPYRYLVGQNEVHATDVLIDAAVVLLVRIHLDGVYWGDCSMSNILWRRDAGALMAYLVDAETTEIRPSLGDGMRHHDLTIAQENIFGGLLEMEAAGRLRPESDPGAISAALGDRYRQLWAELTAPEHFVFDERWRIDHRVRRINDLGFDVDEMTINAEDGRLTVKPMVVEEGHHARELRQLTGLAVQENQARRLLADIESFRAWLSGGVGGDSTRPIPQAVAAARWLAETYEPFVESLTEEITARLEPPEVYHQMLEHRYYLSETHGRSVSTEEALADLVDQFVLPLQPERQIDIEGQPLG